MHTLAKSLYRNNKPKIMKTLLAPQQTTEQVAKNDNARFQFLMGISNCDEKTIFSLLDEKSLFFGNLNRWQTARWFRAFFQKISFPTFIIESKHGVSLDFYPGAEAYEVIFSPLTLNDLGIEMAEFGLPALPEATEPTSISLKVVAVFEDGKITDIRKTDRIVPIESVKSLQASN